ncbi:G-protein coupled receptor 1 [Mactra antiquata]
MAYEEFSNLTSTLSSLLDLSNETLAYSGHLRHPITEFIEQYIIPVICLFGLLGNTLSSIVFLQKPLRKSSCSIFLTARGFSDNGTLATLLIIWISRTFQLQLGGVKGSCQVIIFLTYVCGCISVWLVVFVTLENYIRICRPFIVNRICTVIIAEIVVGMLCLIAMCIYNFPFWAMHPQNCVVYLHHHDAVQVLVYVDTVITLVVPLICIIILITAIVCDLIKSYNRRSRLRAPTATRVKNPMAKVTKMLFAVTISFFCLNLPSHINRLRIMISSLMQTETSPKQYSSLDEAIGQITLLVYYLSLSINVVVYFAFGSRFRKVLRQLFGGMNSLRWSPTRSKTPDVADFSPRIDDHQSTDFKQSNGIKKTTIVGYHSHNDRLSEMAPLKEPGC